MSSISRRDGCWVLTYFVQEVTGNLRRLFCVERWPHSMISSRSVAPRTMVAYLKNHAERITVLERAQEA